MAGHAFGTIALFLRRIVALFAVYSKIPCFGTPSICCYTNSLLPISIFHTPPPSLPTKCAEFSTSRAHVATAARALAAVSSLSWSDIALTVCLGHPNAPSPSFANRKSRPFPACSASFPHERAIAIRSIIISDGFITVSWKIRTRQGGHLLPLKLLPNLLPDPSPCLAAPEQHELSQPLTRLPGI